MSERRGLELLGGYALLALATACAQPYPAPTAVIVAFDANATQASCKPLAGPLDATIGAPVLVTAGCSKDSSGAALTYAWSLANAPAGSAPELDNAGAVTPTFVPDGSGKFRLGLVVSNGVVASEPAYADIVVGTCGSHAPAVVASASSDAPNIGELVTLSVKVADDDTLAGCTAHPPVYAYAWLLVDVPAQSHAALNATTVESPSFVADVPGRYTVHVTATDPTGKTSPAGELHVDAGTCGGRTPAVSEITPSVAAPVTGETVTLAVAVSDDDTSASCAAHAASFEYAWSFTSLPAGSRASLNDEGVVEPSFVPDVAGDYGFALTVTDPTGRSASVSRTLSVTAAPDQPDEPDEPDDGCGESTPLALPRIVAPGVPAACGDKVIALNLQGKTKVMLDGAASTDRDNTVCALGQTLDYEWTLLSTPLGAGSSALESSNGGSTVLDVAGDGLYKVRLVVTDSTGLSSLGSTCWLHAGNVGWAEQ